MDEAIRDELKDKLLAAKSAEEAAELVKEAGQECSCTVRKQATENKR